MDSPTVLESAGAVVIADGADGLRVAILHRRRPEEWRLAKGKLHPGESHGQAAQREVAEELGLQVELGERLGETHYRYWQEGRSVSKTVVFYLARLPEPVRLAPEKHTFDQARWVCPAEALRLLSWENERRLVVQALRTIGAASPRHGGWRSGNFRLSP
jgi:8-oxo-dGTP diphosphatase